MRISDWSSDVCSSDLFKDSACRIPSFRAIDRSARNNLCAIVVGLQHDNLFRISQDSDIGIVCDDDDLPPLLSAAQHGNQRGVDELAIQIVFGDRKSVV